MPFSMPVSATRPTTSSVTSMNCPRSAVWRSWLVKTCFTPLSFPPVLPHRVQTVPASDSGLPGGQPRQTSVAHFPSRASSGAVEVLGESGRERDERQRRHDRQPEHEGPVDGGGEQARG